ncbi:MAG TPA: hypothetical protein VEL76_00950 [Gemmataceae bacterium]|nr:hypothetical protein [Gemmataceae bacterium]
MAQPLREDEGQERRDWHRLFGLLLTDLFTDSPFAVEPEKDLSHQQQYLDVLVLRIRKGRFVGQLPDGLEDLAPHNLITFKSHHEPLDDWALKELTGHYVSYRKLLRTKKGLLLPESEFRLYAVCSRYPHNLAQQVPWERVQEGIYRCRRGTDVIKVIVAGQLPQVEHNAPLHLFSAVREQVAYGARHYQQCSATTSSLIAQLFTRYEGEGIAMPYTMDDFIRDFTKEHWSDLTPEERRQLLQSLPPEERLAGLAPEEIEAYLKRLREASAESSPKSKSGSKPKKRPKS